MKIAPFLFVIALLASGTLGAFLFKGCGKTKVKTVTYCPPVDMDSLIASLRDTLILPGEQVTKYVPQTVNLRDTAAVDSLLRQFREMEGYYQGLASQLEGAIARKDSAVANAEARAEELELLIKTNEYTDSITTDTYSHRWKIIADGPIRSYSYGIVPIFPAQPTPPRIRNNRIGFLAGAQGQSGALRQLYELQYGRKWFTGQVGYLPKSAALGVDPAVQVTLGVGVAF